MKIFFSNVSYLTTQDKLTFGNKKTVAKTALTTLGENVGVVKKRVRLTREQIKIRDNKVLELLKQGFKQTEIVKMLNLSFSTVNIIAKKLDVFQNSIKKRNKEILEALIKGGKNRQQIAKEFGVSESTIDGIAISNNAYQKSVIKRDEAIMERVLKGMYAKDIAAELNISKDTVERVAKKYGMPLSLRKVLKNT